MDPEISVTELNQWFGNPPPVYLAAYPNKLEELTGALNELQIPFQKTELGFEVFGGVSLETLLQKGLCRIMDLGSQQSMNELPVTNEFTVWDCCCGAGGKSLMLAQLYPGITLYSSDFRENSIHNLKQRFSVSGLAMPFTGKNNLIKPNKTILFNPEIIFSKPVFDCVVADVPCTGSGTWRHNPESLHFFNPETLQNMAEIQLQIAKNAIDYLKPGGYLIYITCSVFDAENRLNSQKIATLCGFEIVSEQYVGGAQTNSDYLFRAILRKNK